MRRAYSVRTIEDLLAHGNYSVSFKDGGRDERGRLNELWFAGDDWGMSDTEKEELYASDNGCWLSNQIGTIVRDDDGNVTALSFGPDYEGHSPLMQLSAYLVRDASLHGVEWHSLTLELEPEGHQIRTKVVEVYDASYGQDDEPLLRRHVIGEFMYDLRKNVFIAA